MGMMEKLRCDSDSRKKKSKKARKDKWGWPVLCEITTEVEEEMEEEELSLYEPNKVVVSGMPYTTTEDDIRDFFEGVSSSSAGHILWHPELLCIPTIIPSAVTSTAAFRTKLHVEPLVRCHHTCRLLCSRCEGTPDQPTSPWIWLSCTRTRAGPITGEPALKDNDVKDYPIKAMAETLNCMRIGKLHS